MQQPDRVLRRVSSREAGGELPPPVLVGIAPVGPAALQSRADDIPAQMLVILPRGKRSEERIEARQLRARRLHLCEDAVEAHVWRIRRHWPRQQRHLPENVHAAPAAQRKATIVRQLTGRGSAIKNGPPPAGTS